MGQFVWVGYVLAQTKIPWTIRDSFWRDCSQISLRLAARLRFRL
jgi:hypothetical protein